MSPDCLKIEFRCFFLFFFALFVAGTETATAKIDEQKVNELVTEFYSYIWQEADYDKARSVADRIQLLGEENNDPELEARGLIRLAYVEILFGKWGNAWEQKLARSKTLIAPKMALANAEYLAFNGYIKGNWQSELETGIKFILRASQLALELQNDELLVQCEVMACQLRSYQRDNYQALKHATRAKVVARDTGLMWCNCAALQQYIAIHQQAARIDRIENEMEQLKKIWPSNHTLRRIQLCLGQNDEYLEEIRQQALELEKRPNSLDTADKIGRIYWNIAYVYFERDEYEKSKEFVQKAIPRLEFARNSSILELAEFTDYLVRIRLNDFTVKYLDEFSEFIESLNFKMLVPQQAIEIANAYESLGQIEKRDFWVKRSALYGAKENDVSWNSVESAEIDSWATEKRNRSQQRANLAQQKRSRTIYTLLSLIGIVATLGMAVFFTRQQTIAKQNLQLEKQVEERTASLSKAMEDALAADEAKSEFLARMNHEIRNPLTAILGFVDIIKHRKEEPEFDWDFCLDGLSASGHHLHDLVDDILEVSKIENSDLEMEYHPFDVRDSVEAVVSIVSAKAEEKSLQVLASLDLPENEKLLGDESRFKQVLLNVATNAIKFTDNGSVSIEVSRQLANDDRVVLDIVIADTGRGIPKSELDRVMEKFSFSSENQHEVGTGLGLYISKLLVEKMGGKLRLESEVGLGTQVYATIPFVPSSETTRKTPPNPNLDVNKNRILVVDDQPLVCQSICLQLEQMGLVTQSTNEPTKALSLVNDWRPDYVLLDLRMPMLSGFEVFARISKLDPRPVVIAMSGDATSEVKNRCNKDGFDGFLIKPFRMTELQQMISKFQNTGAQTT